MKKLLITGFDPFGGEAINPSWEAVRQLPDQVGKRNTIQGNNYNEYSSLNILTASTRKSDGGLFFVYSDSIFEEGHSDRAGTGVGANHTADCRVTHLINITFPQMLAVLNIFQQHCI